MKKSFTIHDLPPSERPRERLLNLGASALSAQEILALILGRGIAGESVMITAQRLLSEFGSLKDIANASIEELSTVKGIGTAKAAQIKAAFELGKRIEGYGYDLPKKSITNPEEAVKLVKNRLKDKKKEYFLAILLDSRNQPINIAQVSIGSLNASIVHPREVFKEAISTSAASVILVHNHPSGDVSPSDEDIQITKRLKESGEIVGINLFDHIIIAGNNFTSLKEQGII
jgi:DNA repair protein RadC